jgi:hypothetical protein
MKVKVKDLKIRDLVRVSDTGEPFLDAAVTKITEQIVTLSRPYILFSEIDREDIANPLIGREDFVIYRSDTEIELIRRGHLIGGVL